MCYKGVFWVIDHKIVSEKVLCDKFGNVTLSDGYEFQTETWSNNHKKIWSKLPRDVTQGRAYNYFPRGRVEIRNNKAIIFLHPSLRSDEIIRKIKIEFALEREQGLRDILVKADGSWHYRCFYEGIVENGRLDKSNE